MAETKISPRSKQAIVKAARRGESFASIARRYDVSRERIRQLVRQMDPSLGPRRKARAEPVETPPRICNICDSKVKPPRYRYCSERCAQTGRVLRQIVLYRGDQNRYLANYTLRSVDDEAKRRWAKRVLAGKAGKKRWIMEGSKTYRLLERQGLLGRLPPDVEIRHRST